ncbi:MAG: 2-C-methyl-D-erythritol 4-phosphate cytidylyltransferase [Verrucomicrobiae bacterium]|nr:2-C-methyl-D-erythritol 4-phosphate cytidylyltransferase [Verrucomicrobiae bacterium]
MVSAILVAAGSGTRFGPDRDKLFLEVAGRPVVAHTWSRLDAVPALGEIIVVVRAGMEPAFEELAAALAPRLPWRLVPGGPERQDSVWNGLQATSPDCEWVAVHDAARPCTPVGTVLDTLAAAREAGAAVTAQRVTDTIKESGDGRWIEHTLDRSRLWAVQTPQIFRRSLLERALEAVKLAGLRVTDDTAACEHIGQRVRLVESRAPNPKVTYPGDVPYIEWLLRAAGSATGQ